MVKRNEEEFLNACWVGHYELAKRFLKEGMNVNVPDDSSGSTPLHKAARMGHMDIVELLLNYGADKYIKNHANKTPPDLAKTEEIRNMIVNFSRGSRALVVHRKERPVFVNRENIVPRDTADKDTIHERKMLIIQQNRTIKELETKVKALQMEKENMRYRYLSIDEILRTVEDLNRSQSGRFTLHDLNCRLHRR